MKLRKAKLRRTTKETDISVKLNIDGTGTARIDTSIPFLDHMLELFARHSKVDLELTCKGDIEVDYHHTTEDCGLALGAAFLKALDKKIGISRYGTGFSEVKPAKVESYVPMDETLVRCVLDFSGRPTLVWRGMDDKAYRLVLKNIEQYDMSTRFRFGLAKEFFKAFVNEAKCTLHIELLYGDEPHHVVEAIFKAFGKAVDQACALDPRLKNKVPSTKGKL